MTPARELDGLRSCILAWRRALLELRFRSGDDPGQLAVEHDDLAAYADAAGEGAPFSRTVIDTPIGELDERAFLIALYRTEVATSIAWALTLTGTITPVEESADLSTLDELLPLYAAPSPRIAAAVLRDPREIATHRDHWSELALTMRDRSERDPEDRTAGMQFSRAFWRHYGLQWVAGTETHVENAAV